MGRNLLFKGRGSIKAWRRATDHIVEHYLKSGCFYIEKGIQCCREETAKAGVLRVFKGGPLDEIREDGGERSKYGSIII